MEAIDIGQTQFLVETALWRLHFHIYGLVDTLGKVGKYVGFQTTQQEGIYAPAQHIECLRVAVALYGAAETFVEGLERAEHSGIEEAEQGIEFGQAVLDGRTAQGKAPGGFQRQYCSRGLRSHILDILRLVQNHGIEVNVFQYVDVVADDGIGGENHTMGEVAGGIALITVVDAEIQPQCETRQFILPVEQQGPRHHHKRVSRVKARGIEEQRDCLDCLSKAHVVCQTASQAVVVEILQPADTCLLYTSPSPRDTR